MIYSYSYLTVSFLFVFNRGGEFTQFVNINADMKQLELSLFFVKLTEASMKQKITFHAYKLPWML